MQPGKTSITLLFNAPTQYVIPVFQRGYVWTLEKQVAPLWSDLEDRADDLLNRQTLANTPAAQLLGVSHKHFLGSLVLTPVPNRFNRVMAYEVIDGQQRTTTLHLLLLAFRDVAKVIGDSNLQQMLEQLTRNSGVYGVSEDHYKVWPTQAGRDEIMSLIEAGDAEAVCRQYPLKVNKVRQERPLLVQSYLYLYHAILAFMRKIDLDDPISPETEKTYSDQLVHSIRHEELVPELSLNRDCVQGRGEILFMTLQDHVQIMTLTLEGEDDPQVIFETLNARGEPLLASDLVRNFVFLEATRNGLPVSDLYSKYWQEFDEQKDASSKVTANRYWREKERQGRITNPRIDLFFYHYTILCRIKETKVGHVFQNFKDWWMSHERDLEVELKRIKKVSGWFKEFISPPNYSRLSEFARLIKILDVSTLIPVYLKLRDLYEDDSPELLAAIADLESYVVRRAVCGYTTKNYNRLFLRLVEVLNEDPDPSVALRSHLLKLGGHSQCWPTDQEFKDKWLTRPVYQDMRVAKVCALLRAIELNSHTANQEDIPLQVLTVEHVLPQAWQKKGFYPIPDMTDDDRLARDGTIHTFGNLTLLTQALNSSVSDGPFHTYKNESGKEIDGKRRRISHDSLLKMNSYFQDLKDAEWNEVQIRRRAESLFNEALKVWPHPEGAKDNVRVLAIPRLT